MCMIDEFNVGQTFRGCVAMSICHPEFISGSRKLSFFNRHPDENQDAETSSA